MTNMIFVGPGFGVVRTGGFPNERPSLMTKYHDLHKIVHPNCPLTCQNRGEGVSHFGNAHI